MRYYSNVQAILLLTAASLKLRFVIAGLIFRVIYSYKREKYHSEDEHLQAVREEGEDSKHAEDVEDGLLQNLDVNGTLHNLLVRETRTWDLMFWSGLSTWATPIENAYFFLVIRTTKYSPKSLI